MDGLLVNSEPLWVKAANKVFRHYKAEITDEQHLLTMGLRTPEFVEHWFRYHSVPEKYVSLAVEEIIVTVCKDLESSAELMPGAFHALNICQQAGFKIGLASSSPAEVISIVMKRFQLEKYITVAASAGQLPFGKPHPEVYLHCAEQLGSHPVQCIAFEDSFNGMIAAKAARMKCIVVPAHHQIKERRWAAADLQLTSLQNFSLLHIQTW